MDPPDVDAPAWWSIHAACPGVRACAVEAARAAAVAAVANVKRIAVWWWRQPVSRRGKEWDANEVVASKEKKTTSKKT